MKPIFPIALILWFVMGFFLCRHYLCKPNEPLVVTPVIEKQEVPTKKCNSSLSFRYSDYEFVCPENFNFQHSNFIYNNLSPQFEERLLEIAEFLHNRPELKMKIKGLFLEEEENPTEYENLGLARANSVKTYFLTLGINSSQLLASAKLADPLCFEDQILTKGIVLAFR